MSIEALRGVDFSAGERPEATADLRVHLQSPSLDTVGAGHGRPLAAVLVKMIDEYALHAGQAHMLRFAALGEMRR
jgi:hypothetical protein